MSCTLCLCPTTKQVALRDMAHSRPQCGNHTFRQGINSGNSMRCAEVRGPGRSVCRQVAAEVQVAPPCCPTAASQLLSSLGLIILCV